MPYDDQDVSPISMDDLENEVLADVDFAKVEELPAIHAAWKQIMYC